MVLAMPNSTTLESFMNMDSRSSRTQGASADQPTALHVAGAVQEQVAQQRIRFKAYSNVAAEQGARLPSMALRRGRLLTLVSLLLLVAAGAHAQAIFSTWQNVGTTAPAQAVTVTATVAGTVSKVEVLGRGVSNLEFAAGTGTSTCASAHLTLGAVCQQSVSFTPSYPGLRTGAVVLLDGSNNVLGTTFLSGVGQGGLDVLTPGNQLDLAGILQTPGTSPSGTVATKALLHQPAGVALDGAANLYIADNFNNEVRVVCAAAGSATIAGLNCAAAGAIYTVAGTGAPGIAGNQSYNGDNGPAASAKLNGPNGIAVDGAGNLYIADTGDDVIRVVSAATGKISTVAGDGTNGYTGDAHAATAAQLNTPEGVTVDVNGNLWIADTYNQVIRRVDAVTGIITTVAGNGALSGAGDGKGTFSGDGGAAIDAGLSLPYAVAFDSYGNMLIPDSANNRIRAVRATAGVITTASTLTTIAGTGAEGGSCANAETSTVALNTPQGVAVDAAGNLYISDTGDRCIRKENATSGEMVALAQNGMPALTLANVPTQAEVYEPVGITVDGLGNVYYADFYYMTVDVIQSNVAVLNYLPTAVLKGELSSKSLPEVVENDGNSGAKLADVSAIAANNVLLDNTTTTCVAPFPLALTEDDDCTIGAYFAPASTGDPLFGNVYVSGNTVNDDNSNSPLNIILVGNGAEFTISLASTPNPSAFGSSVTFTAKVQAAGSTATGSVIFSDSLNGGTPTTLGTTSLTSGQTTFSTSTLAVGVHTITATYGADNQTAQVTQTVYEKTTTSLKATPVSPSSLGTPVTFTATVAGASGGGQTLAGTVTFTDAAATFSANTVLVATSGTTGTATYRAVALPQGTNAITAVFNPADSTLVYPSTGTLTQDVKAAGGITVTSSPATSVYGTPVLFAVAVPTVGSAAATGKVNVSIVPVGSATPASTLTVTLAGNPAAGSASISTLPVGSYNVTASYPGDNNYNAGSTALGYVQVVSQVGTSTALSATPNPLVAGNNVAIKATVTPKSGSATPTGTVTITDNFGGNTITLGGGAQTLSSGAYTFNTSTLAPGAHALTATYSGSTDDATSSGTLLLTVNQPGTTTKLTASPTAPIAGKPVTLTASVTASAGAAVPSGTVTIKDTLNGATTTLGSGALTLSEGTVKLSVPSLAAGTHSLVATYAGDTDDASSSATLSLVVVDATTVATVTATPNPAIVNGNVTFTATVTGNGVTPTGNIDFLANGTIALGSAMLNADGKAQITYAKLAAGSYKITAVYDGDADNAKATSVEVGETVNTIPTATELSAASTTGANSQSILVATVQDSGVSGVVPTGTVTFMNGSTKVGSASLNANGVATLTPVLGTGTYQIVASYAGDAQHAPSTSLAMPITGNGSSFSINITPATISIATSQNATVAVNLTSVSGFTDTVSLGCVGLPAMVNCHFSNIDVKLGANATASTQLTIDTDNPLGGGTTAMNKPRRDSSVHIAALGLSFPFSLMMGWWVWSFRRRYAKMLTAVLFLVLTGAAVLATGCGGGFKQDSATPGSYTIQITGVGVNSNVTQYQTVKLTITK
jgi:hypothetical protein